MRCEDILYLLFIKTDARSLLFTGQGGKRSKPADIGYHGTRCRAAQAAVQAHNISHEALQYA